MSEMHTNMYFSYMKIATLLNLWKEPLGIDLFGNVIYGSTPPKSLENIIFVLKPLNPLYFPATYFFNSKISQKGYLCTDLASFSLRLCQQPIENYLDFVFCMASITKYQAVVNYVEGGQFWGECILGRPLQGKMFSNDQDFNTISFENTFKGRLSLLSKNFKYEGFFQENLPHYFGNYFLNNVKVYSGELRKGNFAVKQVSLMEKARYMTKQATYYSRV